MVIVAGHITVDPEQRESYLAGLHERCRKGSLTQAAVETFRRSAPRNRQGAATRSVSVSEYDIADVRPLFGKGRA